MPDMVGHSQPPQLDDLSGSCRGTECHKSGKLMQPMKLEQAPSPVADSAGNAPFFDKEVAWLRKDDQSSRWIKWAFVFALGAYLAFIALAGTGPINVFHNDPLIMLDNAWRILQGQVVHKDFYSALGPLEYWIVAGGMLFVHDGPRGIAIGTAAFGLVVGLWGWLIARRRVPVIFSLLISTWLILTATAPTPFGFDPRFLSCAMIYNRQGYALLGIILVECAFACETNRFWGGVSSGVSLILLGLLKLNFFGGALILLLVSVVLTRAEASRIKGLLAGAGGVSLILLLFRAFSISPFFSDMLYAIRSRGSSLTLTGTITAVNDCAQSGILWMIAVITVAIIMLTPPAKRTNPQSVNLVVLTIIVLASGPLFIQTNAMENGCELAPLWIVILLDRLSSIHLRTDKKIVTVPLIAVCLGGVAVGVGPDVMSALNLMRYQSPGQKSLGSTIKAPAMESIRFYDSSSFYDTNTNAGDGNGTYYVGYLNDGLTLLASQSSPNESVLSLGFHNPFSYALRRKPAEGGSSFLLVGNSISETHMPSVDRVFGNADLMMLPEYDSSHRASDVYIQNYYRSYLLQHFHLVARSQFWQLYRRTN